MTLAGDQRVIIAKLLDQYGTRVIKKSESRLMRFVGLFSKRFMTDFWTTYRLPFCRPVIAYPDDVRDPLGHFNTLAHESIHVHQFNPWYGPVWMLLLVTVLPLPVFFSGRWFVERRAYLRDIRCNVLTAEQAADILWSGYLWPWPKRWMARWFDGQLSNR